MLRVKARTPNYALAYLMNYNHLLLDGGFKSKGDFFGGNRFSDGIIVDGSGEKKSSSSSEDGSDGSSGFVTTYGDAPVLLRASMNIIISSIEPSNDVQSMLLTFSMCVAKSASFIPPI